MERLCLRLLISWLLAFVPVANIPVTNAPIVSTTVKMQFTETPQRMKFIFSILYETIRRDINPQFTEEVKSGLATILMVAKDRISGVEITPGPKERVVVDFKLSTGGNFYSTIKISLDGFNAGDVSKQKLIASGYELTPIFMYCNWTDSQCPKDNDCIEKCEEKPNLYPLLVLLFIPVIIVVVIVLLWYFKYRKVGEKARINLTELGYVENKSKFGGTLANMTGTVSCLSLADNGVRNEVYTVMGQKTTESDWYTRRVRNLMDSQRNYFLQPLEGVSKPNQRNFGENCCERRPISPTMLRGAESHFVPHRYEQLEDFRRYHSEHYELLLRAIRLPPLNRVDKNDI